MALFTVNQFPMELDSVHIDTYSFSRPLFVHGSKEYAAYDMELQQDVRAAGVFRFSITSDHPLYNSLIPRKTEATVIRGGEARWSGYINRIVRNTPGLITCECIGVLDYLNDSVQLPMEQKNTDSEQVLAFLLGRHNEQMTGCGHKCITLGRMSYSGRTIEEFVIDRPTPTLEVMYEYFNYGVYQLSRSPVDLTLNHIAGSDLVSNDQSVVYGENLISLEEDINCAGMITRLIPLGKNGDNYVTIGSVNNGVSYIDAGTVSKHTPIVGSVVFEDISDPQKLLTAARNYLNTLQIEPSRTLKAEAFDRYILGTATAPVSLGGIIRLNAELFGIDEGIQCTSITEVIGQLYDTRLKFGNE